MIAELLLEVVKGKTSLKEMALDCHVNLTKGSGCIQFKMHRCFLLGRGKDEIPEVWLFRNVRAFQKDALVVMYLQTIFGFLPEGCSKFEPLLLCRDTFELVCPRTQISVWGFHRKATAMTTAGLSAVCLFKTVLQWQSSCCLPLVRGEYRIFRNISRSFSTKL